MADRRCGHHAHSRGRPRYPGAQVERQEVVRCRLGIGCRFGSGRMLERDPVVSDEVRVQASSRSMTPDATHPDTVFDRPRVQPGDRLDRQVRDSGYHSGSGGELRCRLAAAHPVGHRKDHPARLERGHPAPAGEGRFGRAHPRELRKTNRRWQYSTRADSFRQNPNSVPASVRAVDADASRSPRAKWLDASFPVHHSRACESSLWLGRAYAPGPRRRGHRTEAGSAGCRRGPWRIARFPKGVGHRAATGARHS